LRREKKAIMAYDAKKGGRKLAVFLGNTVQELASGEEP